MQGIEATTDLRVIAVGARGAPACNGEQVILDFVIRQSVAGAG